MRLSNVLIGAGLFVAATAGSALAYFPANLYSETGKSTINLGPMSTYEGNRASQGMRPYKPSGKTTDFQGNSYTRIYNFIKLGRGHYTGYLQEFGNGEGCLASVTLTLNIMGGRRGDEYNQRVEYIGGVQGLKCSVVNTVFNTTLYTR